jgi:NACHT domain
MADPLRQPTRPPEPAWVRPCRWLWNQRGFVWGTVILGLALNLIASWLITPPGTTFSQTPLGSLLGHPLLFALGGVGLLGLTAGLWLINRLYPAPVSQQTSPPPQAVLLAHEDRRRLLAKLGGLYQGYLKQSLWAMPRMELGLERTFGGATAHPALFVSYPPAGAREAITPSTPILEVYQEAGDGLLILGKPGAGKSTWLYDLALALTERAERDATQLPPVLVSLSSWAQKRLPLEQWLAEELQTKYQIPLTLARGWLLADQLLPLLDGLDEMAEEARSACIEKINTYRRDHSLPIVVSSRSAEYFSQERRLHLQSAIEVQLLTPQRVDGYLKGGGKPLAAVRAALRINATLRGLLATPLMLRIVMHVYRDKTAKDLPQLGSAEEQQRQVFEHYVTGMLEQPTRKWRYPPDQTRKWLIWLAQQMKQRGVTEFYVERLQPDWLPKWPRILYRWSVGLIFGMVGLPLGALLGLSIGVAFKLPFWQYLGLVCALLMGLYIGVSCGLDSKIEPVEELIWSRKVLWFVLFFVLLGVPASVQLGGLLYGLYFVLLGVPTFVLLGGLLFGISGKQLSERSMLSPNEGIRRSLKYGLLLLAAGLLYGLLVWLIYLWGPFESPMGGLTGLLSALIAGLLIGLIAAPRVGLFAAAQHYTLRFWLWHARLFPWRAVALLEDATTHILLQRVGGGYSFIHPLFQEYFASLETGTPASTQSQPSSSPQP